MSTRVANLVRHPKSRQSKRERVVPPKLPPTFDDDDDDEEEDEINIEEEEEDDNKDFDLELDEESEEEEDEEEKPKVEEEEEGDKDGDAVSGWADSMAKILGSNKPRNKKSLILSRAKLDHEIKIPTPQENEARKKRAAPPKPKLEFEIVGKNESEESPKKPKLEKAAAKDLTAKQARKLELKSSRERKEWENLNRFKPSPSDSRLKEIELLKVATKGVVQLFNAVNLQQKAMKSKLNEAKSSEFKKDKVMKRTKEMFESAMERSQELTKDKDKTEQNPDDSVLEIKQEEDGDDGLINTKPMSNGCVKKLKSKSSKTMKKPSWKALHDDFMLNAKMKDWDQSSGSEDGE